MTPGHPTRRDILRLGGAATATALLARVVPLRAAEWKQVPIGTQLWCVRKQLATDIPGTLKALGAMGYEAVELENAFGTSGPEWRTHLDAAHVRACGFHHRLEELQGDKLAASIEFNQAIGNRNLIIRSLAPPVYTSADLLKKTADAVNDVAERLKPHAMRVGYTTTRRTSTASTASTGGTGSRIRRARTWCSSSTPATHRRCRASRRRTSSGATRAAPSRCT